MAGVAGSSNISGTNISINGAGAQNLNPVDVIAFATGDTVTEISIYVQTAPASDTVYRAGLFTTADFSVDGADGSTEAWSKQFTVPASFSAPGWLDIAVSNEAITATNGHELAVALSSRVSGGSPNFKQSTAGGNRSNAAAGATFVSPWVETGTVATQIALQITVTAAGGTVTGSGALAAQSATMAGTATTFQVVTGSSIVIDSTSMFLNLDFVPVDGDKVGIPRDWLGSVLTLAANGVFTITPELPNGTVIPRISFDTSTATWYEDEVTINQSGALTIFATGALVAQSATMSGTAVAGPPINADRPPKGGRVFHRLRAR